MLTLLSVATLCNATPETPHEIPRATPNERDADALIARLAKPAPASVEFTEVRFSRLLGYSGASSLDRRVTTPYREQTSIRGESVKVEREGEKPRSFALKHAPELRGLLTGFSAMLSGDAATLRQAFNVKATGSGDTWTLQLSPTDATAQRRLHKIEVSGSNSEPHCFVGSDGQGSRPERCNAEVAVRALRLRCSGNIGGHTASYSLMRLPS
jgi:hypothetical protein